MDPNDIRLETRDDGTLRVLGAGTYGKARCPALNTPLQAESCLLHTRKLECRSLALLWAREVWTVRHTDVTMNRQSFHIKHAWCRCTWSCRLHCRPL